MRKLLVWFMAALTLALAGSAVAAPSPALRGIVVGSYNGTLLVTSAGGSVRALAGHARVGARVSLAGGRLTVVGRAHRALITGIVIRHRADLTFLSAAQHVLVVHATRTVAAARDSRPAAGSVVQSTVVIDDHGDLDEQNEQLVGHEAGVEVQAVVTAVAAGSVALTVNGQPLTIPLPAGLTLPSTIVGTQVKLEVEFGEGTAVITPQPQRDDDDADAAAPAPPTTTTTQAVVIERHHDGDGDRHGGDGHRGGDGDG
jgi:hypothetical protein